MNLCRGKNKRKLGSENTFGAVAQISAHIDQNQTVKHIGKLATFSWVVMKNRRIRY